MANCSKKIKNEDTKQSCCFRKHMQEECHQKTKVEIRLFFALTNKDNCVQIESNCSVVICLSKNTANVITSTAKKKKTDGTQCNT